MIWALPTFPTLFCTIVFSPVPTAQAILAFFQFLEEAMNFVNMGLFLKFFCLKFVLTSLFG